jgi:hypothetical protein
LSHIDSRRASNAQDRFKRLARRIRLLRILIPQFFRGDFFNSIDPKRTNRHCLMRGRRVSL